MFLNGKNIEEWLDKLKQEIEQSLDDDNKSKSDDNLGENQSCLRTLPFILVHCLF